MTSGSPSGPEPDATTPEEDHNPWRTRRHDHLVEPLFGALGDAEADTEDADEAPTSDRIARLWAWIRGLRRS